MWAKASHSLAFFQATMANAGMRCRISPAWPLSFAGCENGFLSEVNIETTRLLYFSVMCNSAYASLSSAHILAVLPGPTSFLDPGGYAQACRMEPANLAVTPKSKVCKTSKHTLYSGRPPGILNRVWLVQGLSFKPSKDFISHPGSEVKSKGFFRWFPFSQSQSQQIFLLCQWGKPRWFA